MAWVFRKIISISPPIIINLLLLILILTAILFGGKSEKQIIQNVYSDEGIISLQATGSIKENDNFMGLFNSISKIDTDILDTFSKETQFIFYYSDTIELINYNLTIRTQVYYTSPTIIQELTGDQDSVIIYKFPDLLTTENLIVNFTAENKTKEFTANQIFNIQNLNEINHFSANNSKFYDLIKGDMFIQSWESDFSTIAHIFLPLDIVLNDKIEISTQEILWQYSIDFFLSSSSLDDYSSINKLKKNLFNSALYLEEILQPNSLEEVVEFFSPSLYHIFEAENSAYEDFTEVVWLYIPGIIVFEFLILYFFEKYISRKYLLYKLLFSRGYSHKKIVTAFINMNILLPTGLLSLILLLPLLFEIAVYRLVLYKNLILVWIVFQLVGEIWLVFRYMRKFKQQILGDRLTKKSNKFDLIVFNKVSERLVLIILISSIAKLVYDVLKVIFTTSTTLIELNSRLDYISSLVWILGSLVCFFIIKVLNEPNRLPIVRNHITVNHAFSNLRKNRYLVVTLFIVMFGTGFYFVGTNYQLMKYSEISNFSNRIGEYSIIYNFQGDFQHIPDEIYSEIPGMTQFLKIYYLPLKIVGKNLDLDLQFLIINGTQYNDMVPEEDFFNFGNKLWFSQEIRDDLLRSNDLVLTNTQNSYEIPENEIGLINKYNREVKIQLEVQSDILLTTISNLGRIGISTNFIDYPETDLAVTISMSEAPIISVFTIFTRIDKYLDDNNISVDFYVEENDRSEQVNQFVERTNDLKNEILALKYVYLFSVLILAFLFNFAFVVDEDWKKRIKILGDKFGMHIVNREMLMMIFIYLIIFASSVLVGHFLTFINLFFLYNINNNGVSIFIKLLELDLQAVSAQIVLFLIFFLYRTRSCC